MVLFPPFVELLLRALAEIEYIVLSAWITFFAFACLLLAFAHMPRNQGDYEKDTVRIELIKQ